MPNKTIYVADADLPIFERAQEMAGENLSATIAQALRRFVEAETARAEGYGEIVLKVGDHGTYANKAFLGRELAKRRDRDHETHKLVTQNVYQTAKGRLVLYTRVTPDWYAWMSYWEDDEPSARRGRGRRGRGDTGVDVNVDVNVDVAESGAGRYDWTRHKPKWKSQWWSEWSAGNEYRMVVYDSLDDLKPHIAEELYNAVVQALRGEDVEFLDI